MNRLALTLALVFVFAGASCDDDDDNKPTPPKTDGPAGDTPSGGDAGGDAGGATQCTGTFAALTRARLGMVTAPAGKCSSATDLDFICTGNIAASARTCGANCLNTGITGPALAACVSTCVQGAGKVLTGGCGDCYAGLFTCSVEKCLAECAMPDSAACAACQQSKGCFPEFFQCSGLPAPGSVPDAGPDVAGEAGAETATEVRTETAAEAAAETATEAAAETTPEAGAPDVAPDTTPDAGAPDAGADAADATAG